MHDLLRYLSYLGCRWTISVLANKYLSMSVDIVALCFNYCWIIVEAISPLHDRFTSSQFCSAIVESSWKNPWTIFGWSWRYRRTRFWWHVHGVCVVFDLSLDYLWVIFGYLWGSMEGSLNHLWIMFDFQIIFESTLKCLWLIVEASFDNRRTLFNLCLICPRPMLNYRWMISTYSLSCVWVTWIICEWSMQYQ